MAQDHPKIIWRIPICLTAQESDLRAERNEPRWVDGEALPLLDRPVAASTQR